MTKYEQSLVIAARPHLELQLFVTETAMPSLKKKIAITKAAISNMQQHLKHELRKPDVDYLGLKVIFYFFISQLLINL
jgi:hypothetical protein